MKGDDKLPPWAEALAAKRRAARANAKDVAPEVATRDAARVIPTISPKRAQLRRNALRREAARVKRLAKLLAAIKKALPALKELLVKTNEHWAYEDLVYRFYHQSYKVYGIQERTSEIVEALRALLPDATFNDWFMQIVAEGTGRARFNMEDNKRWLEITRPMVEAFFHARYFLEMVVRYGRELDEPPNMMPSGWAAVLYLYGLR
jgi:hypothetical protein